MNAEYLAAVAADRRAFDAFAEKYRSGVVTDLNDLPFTQWGPIIRGYYQVCRERPERRTKIYFIQRGGDGPIKIGVTGDVAARMKTLQNATPERLRLLGVYYGFGFEERQLHEKYAAHRIRGEWFEPAEEILEDAGLLNDEMQEVLRGWEAA